MKKQLRIYVVGGLCAVTLLSWLVWQSFAQPVVFSPGKGGGGSEGVAGVSSFNLRAGAVSLTKGDVTALGALDNDTTGNAATADASKDPTFRISAPSGVASALQFYSNGGVDQHVLVISGHNHLSSDVAFIARNFTVPSLLVTYSSAYTLDFDGYSNLWIPLEGDITVSSANLFGGRGITVRFDAGAADRVIHLPTWHFLAGAQAITLGAGKTGILSVVAYDGTDGNCVATWASE